jgi:hypothetical protein
MKVLKVVITQELATLTTDRKGTQTYYSTYRYLLGHT